MPSRASTSLLLATQSTENCAAYRCQCPHGLMPHCYVYEISVFSHSITGVNALTGLCLIVTWVKENGTAVSELCQCPHGLMPHCYVERVVYIDSSFGGVNALTGLCLIVTL